MNPLTSPTYIRLIATYLPVSKRLLCDRLLRNGKAQKIVKDFSDLVGLALLNRAAHHTLSSGLGTLVIPFPVSHFDSVLETLDYINIHSLHLIHKVYCAKIDLHALAQLPSLEILNLENITVYWSNLRSPNDWPSLKTVFFRNVESIDAPILDQFQPCHSVGSIQEGVRVIGYRLGRPLL